MSLDAPSPLPLATPAPALACPREEAHPWETLGPTPPEVPFVFASPHSGRRYTPGFLAQTALSARALRDIEDAYVDALFAAAPEAGATLLRAHFPRSQIDLNRDAREIDATMFADIPENAADPPSPRVAAGYGVIPRRVPDGREIYAAPLPFAEARRRISALHEGYHAALGELVRATRQRFGICALIDCHSMPSPRSPFRNDAPEGIDIVLGDRFGTACTPTLTAHAERLLRAEGFTLRRNRPYAGGFTIRHHGAPKAGIHALQIEVSRGLYLDETEMTRSPAFADTAERLGRAIRNLLARDHKDVFGS